MGHEVKSMMGESAKGFKSNESGWGTLTWDLITWCLSTEHGIKI